MNKGKTNLDKEIEKYYPLFNEEEVSKLQMESGIRQFNLGIGKASTIATLLHDKGGLVKPKLLFNRTQRHIIIHHPSMFNEWKLRLLFYKLIRRK